MPRSKSVLDMDRILVPILSTVPLKKKKKSNNHFKCNKNIQIKYFINNLFSCVAMCLHAMQKEVFLKSD